jgi:hypothetical protein
VAAKIRATATLTSAPYSRPHRPPSPRRDSQIVKAKKSAALDWRLTQIVRDEISYFVTPIWVVRFGLLCYEQVSLTRMGSPALAQALPYRSAKLESKTTIGITGAMLIVDKLREATAVLSKKPQRYRITGAMLISAAYLILGNEYSRNILYSVTRP